MWVKDLIGIMNYSRMINDSKFINATCVNLLTDVFAGFL